MGMAFNLEKGQCTSQDIVKAARMVPKALEPYVIGECRQECFHGAGICQLLIFLPLKLCRMHIRNGTSEGVFVILCVCRVPSILSINQKHLSVTLIFRAELENYSKYL